MRGSANSLGMEDTRENLRVWVRDILTRMKITPTKLAERVGVHPTTLTRFLNHPDASTLSSNTVAKIAHVAGLPAPHPVGAPIGLAALRPAGSMPGLMEAEAEPFQAGQQQGGIDAAIERLTAGRNSADAWVLRTTTLELVGHLPGDIVIVDLAAKPERGDVVCAQVYRWSEGKADTIFRLFEPPYLVAASLTADLRKPIIVDNDRVIIKGVVTELLRARRPHNQIGSPGTST